MLLDRQFNSLRTHLFSLSASFWVTYFLQIFDILHFLPCRILQHSEMLLKAVEIEAVEMDRAQTRSFDSYVLDACQYGERNQTLQNLNLLPWNSCFCFLPPKCWAPMGATLTLWLGLMVLSLLLGSGKPWNGRYILPEQNAGFHVDAHQNASKPGISHTCREFQLTFDSFAVCTFFLLCVIKIQPDPIPHRC